MRLSVEVLCDEVSLVDGCLVVVEDYRSVVDLVLGVLILVVVGGSSSEVKGGNYCL